MFLGGGREEGGSGRGVGRFCQLTNKAAIFSQPKRGTWLGSFQLRNLCPKTRRLLGALIESNKIEFNYII